jgi:ribose/xylose/arabinose/galactoside ABC-type transport system permease subunit
MLLLGSALGPFLALGVVVLFFAAADAIQGGETFLSGPNLRALSKQIAPIAVAALGMTIIIISGGIDLSAGTAIALCATVLAWSLKEDVGPWIGVTLALLAGCLCGFINGALISLLRVVPFIVTLGTMTFYLGLAKILAHESTVRPDRSEQIPQWLINFLSIRESALIYGFPAGVWLAIVLSLLLAALLRYSVFSRYLFALGSNESTARLCGIDVTWNKIVLYTLAGLFVGVAGIYQFSLLSAGNPTSGIGLELKIIAAVVIGGGSLSGGRGSVLGTITGAAIMAVIASGCTLLGLSNPIQEIILGVIIVVAVTVDQIRRARQVG